MVKSSIAQQFHSFQKEKIVTVLKQCQIETAQILAQLVPKKYRKQLVRDLVAEKSRKKLPPDGAIESLEKLIVSE